MKLDHFNFVRKNILIINGVDMKFFEMFKVYFFQYL